MSTITNPAIEQIIEPVYKVLAEFMEQCSDDPETREAAVSTLLFSFWQMATRGVMPKIPSLALVNAGDKDQDPILRANRKLCNYKKDEREDIRGSGRFAGGTPTQAPKAMLHAVCALQKHQQDYPTIEPISNWEAYYHDARVTGYGKGDIRPYTGAVDPKLGLPTDKLNSILLLLDEKKDWEAFRHDLLSTPQNIQAPAGIGQGLQLVDKIMTLSGSISADECDDKLVDAVLELGKPFFFLPHVCSEPINIPNYPALSYFSLRLNDPKILALNFPLLPQDKWCSYYQDWIFQRLAHLPQNYRFGVLETVHQLQSVCETLTLFAGPANGESTPETRALACNLFNTALRSIALSLAFLAWHGLGIELACSLRTVRKVLKVLREDGGSMSLRDLQQATGIGKAATRDVLLVQLENQGLVTLDDNLVSATYIHEFIQNIQEQLPIATKA